MCATRSMKMGTTAPNHKRHRFPPAISGHTIWLCSRFTLRYRDVEELLAERGVIVTDETVRQWCGRFSQGYANELRRRRPRVGDKWHPDKVFIRINGATLLPLAGLDQDGQELDIPGQPRRDKRRPRRSPTRPSRACVTCHGSSACQRRALQVPGVQYPRGGFAPAYMEGERRMRRCNTWAMCSGSSRPTA